MAKIDYSKGEESIDQALQKMRMKQLQEGKPITSERAVQFFGLDDTEARPLPEDSVERLLEEEAFDNSLNQGKEAGASSEEEAHAPRVQESEEPDEEYEEFGQARDSISHAETIAKSKPRIGRKEDGRHEKRAYVSFENSIASADEKISPLLTLRKHIFWLKLQGFEDRYERIGTTKAEIFSLRRKEELSSEDLSRIEQLIRNARELKRKIQSRQGQDSDETLIETKKKYYKSKHLNVRDRWLKL